MPHGLLYDRHVFPAPEQPIGKGVAQRVRAYAPLDGRLARQSIHQLPNVPSADRLARVKLLAILGEMPGCLTPAYGAEYRSPTQAQPITLLQPHAQLGRSWAR